METLTRPQSPPLEGTASAQFAIARVKYTHDAMIDLVIANPAISQNDIAKHFGYSVPWVSRVMNSDAFLARLAQRKADIVDPSLVATVEEKLAAIASKSADIILDKLATTNSLDAAFKGLEIAGKLKGYGARNQGPVVNNNFVVALPSKAASEVDWMAQHSPLPKAERVEPTPQPDSE